MKKISKLLLVLILLFTIGIAKVQAYTPTFRAVPQSVAGMKESGLITYDWFEGTSDTGHIGCVNSADYACKYLYEGWNLYAAQIDTDKYYILYCLNLSKNVIHDGSMNQYDNIDNLIFNDSTLSTAEKNRRKELLKDLLLYGYNSDPTNNTSIVDLVNNDKYAPLKLIAMQVLVWEVMEGGRTNFESAAPDAWNGANSLYNKVVYPNGGSDPTKTNTIYYFYNKYKNDARLGDQANPAPAFDPSQSHYVMTWDSVNKKYNVTVSGIGDYNKCTSSDPTNVPISVNASKRTVTVTSSKTVKQATITCKYYRGTGLVDQSVDESFKHFTFVRDTSSNQDMVYGSGWKIYTKSFTVSSENTDFAIRKIDTEGAKVSGAKFNLTHMTNQSYSVTIDSNTNTKYSLNYSGQYRVSESTVPKGYEKIKDFNITINGRTHKVTSCDNQGTDSQNNMTCLNGQVKVTYNGDEILLTIQNVAKNFKILKVNKNGNAINGATFEIRDKNNNLMKFSMASGNIYKYDTAGTITSLYNGSLASYPVSLLPEGEYKIIETSVPYPYRLSSNEADRTTLIKIDSNRNLLVYNNKQKTYVASGDATVRVTNYTTKFNILKIGHGTPLEGVQFELYNSDKSQKIKSVMSSAGVYDYVDNQDSIENYVYVTNSSGYITVNNLPEGTYYLKEIYTIPPYVLPTGDALYTKIEVKIDANGVAINNSYTNDTEVISNTPNSFNFYKKDTEGNPLTTGKYKLQKYDKEANKYVDLKLVEVENDGTYSDNTDIYKVDEENGKIQFTLSKGVATFIDMESSATYRIIETVAPAGYTKASTKDTATVHIDEYGNASGLLVLVDQKIIKEDDSAFAELIINIQTGKQRIMYAAVIVLVIGIIVGLIVYNKRK